MPTTTAPPTPGLRRAQLEKAAAALLAHAKAQRARGGGQLFDDEDEFVYMILSLKKVPQESRNDKPVRLPIPHPIFTFDGAEVCLFVKDAPGGGAKAAKAKAADQKLAAAAGVSRVLALSKLRQKFEPHEAKRKLAAAYDLFLADARILRSLPKALGKAFFKSKKQPIPVDLSRKDWAGPVKDAVAATYLFRGGGSCVNIKVGRTSQTASQIADNVEAALAAALPHVAKAWAGVASLLLKLAASAALPVYQAAGGGKEGGVEGDARVAVEA